MLILIFTLIAQAVTTRNKPLELPVAGAEHAPSLVEFLRQQNVIVKPAPADPQAAVRAGDAAVVLVIPPAYGDTFRAGRPATVQLVVDNSRQSASGTIDRARELLEGYSSQVGNLRLVARGVSPIATQALAIEDVDVATSQSRAANLLNLMPYFIIFALFSGGAGFAAEQARDSKLPQPISRASLGMGASFPRFGARVEPLDARISQRNAVAACRRS